MSVIQVRELEIWKSSLLTAESVHMNEYFY